MAVRATSFRRAEALGGEPFTIVVLDADARHIRRRRITLATGEDVLVDLEKPVHLEQGDQLVLEDGRTAQVVAAPEDLMEVTARDARHLTELAWHIGNRHTPAEITASAIYIKPDHVLAEMVEGLGAHVHAVRRPFGQLPLAEKFPVRVTAPPTLSSMDTSSHAGPLRCWLPCRCCT